VGYPHRAVYLLRGMKRGEATVAQPNLRVAAVLYYTVLVFNIRGGSCGCCLFPAGPGEIPGQLRAGHSHPRPARVLAWEFGAGAEVPQFVRAELPACSWVASPRAPGAAALPLRPPSRIT
jgi:hypothetical protein